MKSLKIPLFVLLAWVMPDAGVVVSSKVMGLEGNGEPVSTQKIWVEKDKLCAVIQNQGKETRVIYRKDKDAIFMVDATAKSYTEMTREDVKKAGDRLQEAREKMQEAMKNVPPEQRAMMEKMMGNMGAEVPPAAAKTEFKKTGSSKVGSWKTEEYDGIREGKRTTHLWVVDYVKLGVSREDFTVMKELGDFFSSLKMATHMDFMKESESLPGFPVRSATVGEDGKDKVSMEVLEIKKEGVSPSQFDIPADFTKKKFEVPDMNGGKGSKRGRSRG